MKYLLVIAVYSLSLFAAVFILLDIEHMLYADLSNNLNIELPPNALLELLEEIKFWNQFSALFTFVFLVVKCFFIALILYTGLFFVNLHKGVRLGRLFKVAVISEAVFVIAGISKILVGSISGLSYTEFTVYYPLSAFQIFDLDKINLIWHYPLQTLNIFELIYCIVLVYSFSQEVELDKINSSKIVLGSYLFALSFWMVLVMFLTLNLT
jgi:hypothetical protein